MADKKIVVPEGMLKAATEAVLEAQCGGRSPEEGPRSIPAREQISLEAALRWLDEILHERNPDFHRAILKREKERIPGDDGDLAIIARRVDFEYGVSFARNYIRDMFVEREPVSVPCVYCGSTEMMGRNYEKNVCGPCYNMAVPFHECPPGLFSFKGGLGFKTEYGADEAYVVASGERFWGGASTKEERLNLKVIPISMEDLTRFRKGPSR
jgi:hypothetical protein